MKIGTVIKERRNELGMTQEDVSLKSGVSSRHIASLEKNKYSPNLATLSKLLRALDLEISVRRRKV